MGHEPNRVAGEGVSLLFLLPRKTRPHVHVQHPTGEAKFWLDPTIEVAQNWGLTKQRLTAALRLAREHADEIRTAWKAHFGS